MFAGGGGLEGGCDGGRCGRGGEGWRVSDGESYDRRAWKMVNGGRQLTNAGGPWVVMTPPVRRGKGGVAMGGGATRCGRERINLRERKITSRQLVSAGAAGCGNSFSSDSEDEGEEGTKETRGEREEREVCYRSRLPLVSLAL